MLLSALLIPLGSQFAHAFESHELLDCHTEKQEHLHEHEFDCAIFHFKINNDTSHVFSIADLPKIEIPAEAIFSMNIDIRRTNIQNKSSRAPPILLF